MLEVGNEVWWLHTPRGGYGWTSRLWARVIGFTGKRVKIAVALRNGGAVEKTVTADKLIDCAEHYRRAFNDLIAWG